MRRLNGLDPGHAADGAAISHLDPVLGVRFPAHHIQFMSRFSGANNPVECTFEFNENDGSARIGHSGSVLEVDGDDTESIIATVTHQDSQLPKDVVPVVSTGDGDHVCIDFRNDEHDAIVYFAQEKNDEDSIIPLAKPSRAFPECSVLRPMTFNHKNLTPVKSAVGSTIDGRIQT